MPAFAAGSPLGRSVLFVHLVLSPLVFSRAMEPVFDYPKVLLLLLTGVVLGALALARLTRTSRGTRGLGDARARLATAVRVVGRDPLLLGVLLFGVSAVASTAASVSPRTSLGGAEHSFAGLPTMLAYGILFFATRWLCGSQHAIRRLLLAPTIGASVAAVYAIVQLAAWDPFHWGSSQVQGVFRAFGTLGHPNHLGGFLVMTIPLCAYAALRSCKRGRWALVALMAVVALLGGVGVAVSLSRGAYLACAAMVGVLIVGWWRGGERRAAAVVAGTVLLALGALAGTVLIDRGGSLIRGVIGRAGSVTHDAYRENVWRVGLAIVRDSPFLGSGLDTFQLAFEGRRSLVFGSAVWNMTAEKAHNEALQILATQGMLGGVALLLLTVGVAVAACRAARRVGGDGKPLLVAVVASITGFYVQDLFSFTVVPCGALFVTLLGVLSIMGRPVAAVDDGPAAATDGRGWLVGALVVADVLAAATFLHNVSLEATRPSIVPFAASVVLGVALGIVSLGVMLYEEPVASGAGYGAPRRWSLQHVAIVATIWTVAALVAHATVYRPLRANMAYREGKLLLEHYPAAAVTRLEQAVSLHPTRDVYWEALGRASESRAGASQHPDDRRRVLTRARQAFAEAVRLVPLNSFNHANLGRVLAQLDGPGNRAAVFAALDEALRLNPTDGHRYAEAASIALLLGDHARATAYASRGMTLYPGYAAFRWQLGRVAVAESRLEDAVALFRQALDAEWHDVQGLRAYAASDLATTTRRLDEARAGQLDAGARR